MCGSGKTEIVLKVISYAISNNKRVGFAVPRRDVIIELHQRFAEIFKENSVICVYGGHHENIEADLVCLTTHQLFRYKEYFDLLILDEIDAFPYKDNDVLEAIFKRSLKGHYILMSATPSDKQLNTFHKKGKAVLSLNTRFHGHPLPVPKYKKCPGIIKYLYLIFKVRYYQRRLKKVFVFCPTINICESTFNFLNVFIKKGNCVHSKKLDRDQIIRDFKFGHYDFLVTTAVLERGVTFSDLQVIVFKADSNIFDSSSLTQIAGRVGRKKDAPYGDVIYIIDEVKEQITDSIKTIESANKSLQDMPKRNKGN